METLSVLPCSLWFLIAAWFAGDTVCLPCSLWFLIAAWFAGDTVLFAVLHWPDPGCLEERSRQVITHRNMNIRTQRHAFTVTETWTYKHTEAWTYLDAKTSALSNTGMQLGETQTNNCAGHTKNSYETFRHQVSETWTVRATDNISPCPVYSTSVYSFYCHRSLFFCHRASLFICVGWASCWSFGCSWFCSCFFFSVGSLALSLLPACHWQSVCGIAVLCHGSLCSV